MTAEFGSPKPTSRLTAREHLTRRIEQLEARIEELEAWRNDLDNAADMIEYPPCRYDAQKGDPEC
jgi:hypothetical protein